MDLSAYMNREQDLGVPVRYKHCPFCGHDVSAKGFIVTRTAKGFIMWCHRCHAKKFMPTGMPSMSECVSTGASALTRLRAGTSLDAQTNDQTQVIDTQTYKVELPPDCTEPGVMPDCARLWLAKYGITDAEIKEYGFCWSPFRERLILPVRNSSGDVIFWQGRYFGTDATASKYHNVRLKRVSTWFDTGGDTSNVTVLCEDILSAIAIHRENGYRAIALLGCYVNDQLIDLLQSEGRQVLVWLDPDKQCEALRYAKRLSSVFGISTRAIIRATVDPKEYKPCDIKTFIEGKDGCDDEKANDDECVS